MFYFNEKDLKTKQDYINALDELNTYYKLEAESFDFGSGLIENDMSYGSERAYYKKDIEYLENIIDNWDYSTTMNNRNNRKSMKKRPHKSYYLYKEKKHLKRLKRVSFMLVSNQGEWKKRFYRGKYSPHLKKVSNKKVRNYKGSLPPKGNTHRKIYDFWWNLY